MKNFKHHLNLNKLFINTLVVFLTGKQLFDFKNVLKHRVINYYN